MNIVRYAAVTALVMAPLGVFAADLPAKTAPKTPSMVTASSQAMAFYVEGQLGMTQVMDLARQNQHPLQCTIEKE